MPSRSLDLVDHLLFASPDLERGIAAVESILGVRPAPGGRHPDYGTHNALLSIGPRTYLEVIAPDPAQPVPARGSLFGMDAMTEPRLVTWVLRAEAIEAVAARAASAADLALGPVVAGGRDRPDGTRVRWKVTDPYPLPLGGTVPFLIAWGDGPHPAASAPPAGRLEAFHVTHPDPEAVARAFRALDLDLPVAAGARPALRASIRIDGRLVELR